MTVQQDLQKAVAAAEAAQGGYLMFASATQDTEAQQMYQTMAEDMTRHAQLIQERVDYLGQANALNQPQQAAPTLPTAGFGPRSKKKRHK